MKKTTTLLFVVLMVAIFNSCSLQNRIVQTELYFGLSLNNGNIISDSAWNVFVQKEVSPVFVGGFTIIQSNGKWYDTLSGQLHSEPSRMILSVNKLTPQASAKIDSLREKYKLLFQQQSVLRVDKKVTISF
jgi:Protein of unknown function (DUF3574)